MTFCFELPSSNKVGREVAPGSAGNVVELGLQSKEQRLREQTYAYSIWRETVSLTYRQKTINFITELY